MNIKDKISDFLITIGIYSLILTILTVLIHLIMGLHLERLILIILLISIMIIFAGNLIADIHINKSK
jgi:hypothetical protein